MQLEQKFQNKGIEPCTSAIDADVLIVQSFINASYQYEPISIVGQDIILLTLLIARIL